jgi:site-specific recombinase XerD
VTTDLERFGAAAELIAALDSASDLHAATLRPSETKRAYAADFKVWQSFTTSKGLPVDAITRGTLRAFVHHLWDTGSAPTTIDRRLAGVVVTLRREYGGS